MTEEVWIWDLKYFLKLTSFPPTNKMTIFNSESYKDSSQWPQTQSPLFTIVNNSWLSNSHFLLTNLCFIWATWRTAQIGLQFYLEQEDFHFQEWQRQLQVHPGDTSFLCKLFVLQSLVSNSCTRPPLKNDPPKLKVSRKAQCASSHLSSQHLGGRSR